MPMPFPRSYVEGFDLQKREFEQGKWSYASGEYSSRGWWWYYCYAFTVKTPVGTIALLAIAILCGGYHGIARASRTPEDATDVNCSILDEIVLLAPALLVITLVSAQTGFSRYYRCLLYTSPSPRDSR